MGSSARSAVGSKLLGSRWPQGHHVSGSFLGSSTSPSAVMVVGGVGSGSPSSHVVACAGLGLEDPWLLPVGYPSLWRGSGGVWGAWWCPRQCRGWRRGGGSSVVPALPGANGQPKFEHPLMSARGCSHQSVSAGALETHPSESQTRGRVRCCHWVLWPGCPRRRLWWPHRHPCMGEAAQGCSALSGSRTQREKQPQGSSLVGQEENSPGNRGFVQCQPPPRSCALGTLASEAQLCLILRVPWGSHASCCPNVTGKGASGISKPWGLNELKSKSRCQRGGWGARGTKVGPRDAGGCSSTPRQQRGTIRDCNSAFGVSATFLALHPRSSVQVQP